MPPTAKKYRTDIPKSSSDVSDKESKGTPEKIKVVSGQLERSLTKKRKARKGPFKSNRGVVFVKNLPHGFFEEQLQKYFGQFGKVTRVRLARSLRTGGSKGFAFVEFAVPEVAEIAAETMNNYLMFRKIVKAAYIPPSEQKFNYFKTSLRKIQNKRGKDVYVSAVTKRVAKKVAEMNNWSAENYEKRMKKTQAKLRAMKRDFGHLGFDPDSVVPQMPISSSAADEKAEEENMAPAKKQKLDKSTSEESNKSTSKSADTNPSPAKSNSSGTTGKPAKKQKTKQDKKPKVADTTLGRLLDETIEDDSSDDDFVPDNVLASSDENGSSSDDSESESAVKSNGNAKTKKVQKTKPSALKSLIDDTIEDEDSSDDDFEPEDENDSMASLGSSAEDDDEDQEDDDDDEESSDDEENSDGEDESSEDEEESSPSKSNNFRKETRNKLDKIGQKKPVGGIRKKNKVEKPVKSQALKQKIQESVKEMAKQTKMVQIKPKNLKKGKKKGGL